MGLVTGFLMGLAVGFLFGARPRHALRDAILDSDRELPLAFGKRATQTRSATAKGVQGYCMEDGCWASAKHWHADNQGFRGGTRRLAYCDVHAPAGRDGSASQVE